jgi:type II secretory pathway pseudopilin PulG
MKFGFSAVELLLVAGIISILVAMSVPGYLEMKVRAEIVDTTATMHDVKIALFKYKIDFHKLPEPPYPGNPNPLQRLVQTRLLDREPVDRFKKGLRGYGGFYADSYLYYDFLSANKPAYRALARRISQSIKTSYDQVVDENTYFLRSIGPDQTDFRDEGGGRDSNNQNRMGIVEYDPTNGVFSLGEITSLWND